MATNQGVLQTVQPSVGGFQAMVPKPLTMRDGNKAQGSKQLVAQPWFVDGLTDDSNGTISAIVKVQGVVQPNAVVQLVHRKTSQTVATARSDKNGQVTFANLNRDAAGEYYAIAFSEDDYNALIYDKLTAL